MSEIGNNIKNIYARREAVLFALSKQYAERALQIFNDAQKNQEEYWNNQTFQAVDSVFSDAFREDDFIGFFIAHGKDYGVYLELANDRQNEALRPIIDVLWIDFKKDVERLFK